MIFYLNFDMLLAVFDTQSNFGDLSHHPIRKGSQISKSKKIICPMRNHILFNYKHNIELL